MKLPSGLIIWITGLSGTGKTTLANKLTNDLSNENNDVFQIDGDVYRKIFKQSGFEFGFELKERKKLANFYSHYANYLSKQGFTVVVSTISLFEEIFLKNRKINKNYFEIFLDSKLEKINNSVKKNIYSKYSKNVIGVDIHPELPHNPDIVLDLHNHKNMKEIIKIIKDKIEKKFRK